MNDYTFLQNKINGKWVISAPRRSHRTNVEKKAGVCPFCPGKEIEEEELYRVGEGGEWKVRVVSNKFPFAPNHEVIIHSPDHHKNFDELPLSAVELILKTYRERFNFHKNPTERSGQAGQVYIFNNSGSASGASLAHPHSQLVMIPQNIKLDIAPLDQVIYSVSENSENSESQIVRQSEAQKLRNTDAPSVLKTDHFLVFCPVTSEWPDEVWIAPKQNGGGFGFIKDSEITDMAFILSRLVQIFDLRHGHEFPFNFYIPPLKNWYLRLIPRTKILGGFELGTNIIVNTQKPADTFAFIKEHFWEPDHEKIKNEHQAEYAKKV